MRRTFDYIREKYNGVDGYLDYIGFGEKQREGLQNALALQKMQVDATSPQFLPKEDQQGASKDNKPNPPSSSTHEYSSSHSSESVSPHSSEVSSACGTPKSQPPTTPNNTSGTNTYVNGKSTVPAN